VARADGNVQCFQPPPRPSPQAGGDFGDLEVPLCRSPGSEALLRVEAVVIKLFERALDAGLVFVVLVGWIGRPVPCRCEHLDQQQPGGRVAFREDPVDLPLGDALAADFDREPRRVGSAGPAPSIPLAPRRSPGAAGSGAQPVARAWWQQERRRLAGEDVLALATFPKPSTSALPPNQISAVSSSAVSPVSSSFGARVTVRNER